MFVLLKKTYIYCSLLSFESDFSQLHFFPINIKTTMSVTKSTVTLIQLFAMHIALSFNYIRTTYTYSYSLVYQHSKWFFLLPKKWKLNKIILFFEFLERKNHALLSWLDFQFCMMYLLSF